jgi:acetyl-CoA carboxylase biotin carboxyl carrier protein
MTTSDKQGARPVELTDVTEVLTLLRDSGWRRARLRTGDFELELSDGSLDIGGEPAAAANRADTPQVSAGSGEQAEPAAAPASGSAPASPPSTEAGGVVVRAQSIGVFWRSPQPGAPPFVEVGDTVQADTPLGIVEVMKMMTRIEPGVAGVVAAIHVDNGETVEFDQPLVTITPA